MDNIKQNIIELNRFFKEVKDRDEKLVKEQWETGYIVRALAANMGI